MYFNFVTSLIPKEKRGLVGTQKVVVHQWKDLLKKKKNTSYQ